MRSSLQKAQGSSWSSPPCAFFRLPLCAPPHGSCFFFFNWNNKACGNNDWKRKPQPIILARLRVSSSICKRLPDGILLLQNCKLQLAAASLPQAVRSSQSFQSRAVNILPLPPLIFFFSVEGIWNRWSILFSGRPFRPDPRAGWPKHKKPSEMEGLLYS